MVTLPEKVFYLGIFYDQGAQTVPKIVESENALPFQIGTLIIRLDKRASQFNGKREIVVHEILRKEKQFLGGHLLYRNASAYDIPIASYNLLIPLDPIQ